MGAVLPDRPQKAIVSGLNVHHLVEDVFIKFQQHAQLVEGAANRFREVYERLQGAP